MEELVIHTDGGARGNPGPAAAAFVIEGNEKLLHQESKFLGKATNNFAEYQGVVLALTWLTKNSPVYLNKKIIFILDSELVVKQLNGIYKVRDENIRKLFLEVTNLIIKLPVKIFFKSVSRSENKKADALVNRELDQNI